MSHRTALLALSLALVPALARAEDKATLWIPGVQCAQCVERLSGSLAKAGAVPDGLSPETKLVEVTYDPAKVTIHQLAQAIAETEPVHGKRYEAGLVVSIEDPAKNLGKVQKALRSVRGLGNVSTVSGAPPGTLVVSFAPINRQTKASDFVKASQVAEALEKANIKYSNLDAGKRPAAFGDAESKRTPAAPRTPGRPKAEGTGDDKPARPASSTTRSPTGSSARPPAAKPREATAEEPPRFQILAAAGDKVYLVDHEAKLKKFVKPGDQFGEFVVKEMADDDGWFVVLENPDTKETVRVESESREKAREEKGGDRKESGTPDAEPKKGTAPPAGESRTSPDASRFQILAVAGDKVYLADHEANLKKFVKPGDRFGDFIVKEVADRDGWFVVLENSSTKETVRVEERKKDKGKDAKKDSKDQPAKGAERDADAPKKSE